MEKKDLDTPSIVIDQDILVENVKRASEIAIKHGKLLRPHIKTHKIPELASLQIKNGAVGICVAKVSEAEIMSMYGIKDILIANEIIGETKLLKVIELARKIKISLLVDSFESLEFLIAAVKDQDVQIGVLVEVESGDHRCGAPKHLIVPLINRIRKVKELNFIGIETFGGFIFHCESREKELENIKYIQTFVNEMRDILKSIGITPFISVGGSPAFDLLAEVQGIDELRPGVYIFNDAATVSRKGAGWKDCALSVIATVISISEKRDYAVIDGGAKTFSYCRPGIVYGKRILHGVLKSDHSVCLSGLSEEHGIIDISDFAGKDDLKVGDKIEIIPAHACPVVNLSDYVYLVSKDEVVMELKVIARGATK